MKWSLILTCLFLLPVAFAGTEVYQGKWTDEFLSFERYDGDFVIIRLPFTPGSTPKVYMDDEVSGDCEIVSAQRVKTALKDEFVVKFELLETYGDEGFNGCRATINRNHEDDEEGLGSISVEIGYHING